MVMRITGWSLNHNDDNSDEVLNHDSATYNSTGSSDSSLERRQQGVFARSRCKHAVCLRAGRVYVLGGKDANVPLSDFWSYDIGTLMTMLF